jgi:hypothetical protein
VINAVPLPSTRPDIVAQETLACLDAQRQIAPLTARSGGLDLASAYRVTAAVRRLREQRGETPVERKIGGPPRRAHGREARDPEATRRAASGLEEDTGFVPVDVYAAPTSFGQRSRSPILANTGGRWTTTRTVLHTIDGARCQLTAEASLFREWQEVPPSPPPLKSLLLLGLSLTTSRAGRRIVEIFCAQRFSGRPRGSRISRACGQGTGHGS